MLKCCYAVLEVKAKKKELTVMFRPKLPASVDTNTAGKYPQVSWKNQMFSHLEMLKSRHKQRCLVWLPSRWTSSSPRHSNQNISMKCNCEITRSAEMSVWSVWQPQTWIFHSWDVSTPSLVDVHYLIHLSSKFTKICNNKMSIYRVQKKTVTPARYYMFK